MSENPPRSPNPNLAFLTPDMNGSDINEPFFRLVAREVDSLTIDGYKLIAVSEVSHDSEEDSTRVVCIADDGHAHVFVYGSGTESTVTHTVVDERDA